MKRVKKSKQRNWQPLYVAGIGNFSHDVQRALEDSQVPFMTGYLYDTSLKDNHCMFWIDGSRSTQDYKRAIGPKLIWRHRLRFFSDLDAFTTSSRPVPESDQEFDTAA